MIGLERGPSRPRSLLDLDRELRGGLTGERLDVALKASQVTTERLRAGPCDPTAATTDRDGFGLIVISGMLVRRVARKERAGAELLGRGDLLRPWLSLGEDASWPFEARWQAIVPVEVAVLDASFARRVSPFPEIATQLLERAMLRSRHLAVELSIVQERRVDRRLHLLLWQLADRWGQMTAEGARVVAPLTHALLADLVAARRPSVTTALRKLAEDGSVTRVGDAWLLAGGPPDW
jgi:CRP-like cAMP-binding protein